MLVLLALEASREAPAIKSGLPERLKPAVAGRLIGSTLALHFLQGE